MQILAQKRQKIVRVIGAIVRVIGAIVLFGLALLIWLEPLQVRTQPKSTQEYFTDDDGTTWFADDGNKITPFNRNGKQAVLARVYQCSDGILFVGYLEKFSDDSQSKIDSSRPTGAIATTTRSLRTTILIKKPHDPKWVRETDPAAKRVKIPLCPNGSTDCTRVLPPD